MNLRKFNRQEEKEDAEMDFLSRILKIYRGNTEPNTLKRRSEEQPDYSQLAKYRRKTNEFPKIIENPFEDDIQIVRATPNVSVPLMSQRRETNKRSVTGFPTRKKNNNFAELQYSDEEDNFLQPRRPLTSSSFESAGTNLVNVNKRSVTGFPLRKNNNFAELQYSDEEDNFLQPRRPLTSSSFESAGLMGRGSEVVDISKHNFNQHSKVNEMNPLHKTNSRISGPFRHNIPVRIEKTSGSSKSQVPPLIEVRKGNIITSIPANVPDLKPIRKSFFSNNLNTFGNNASNNTPSSSHMINTPSTVGNTAYNFQEKERYEELLKILVPSLYNCKKPWTINMENSNRTITATPKNITERKSIHDSSFAVSDRLDLTKSKSHRYKCKSCGTIINLDEYDDDGVNDIDAENTTKL